METIQDLKKYFEDTLAKSGEDPNDESAQAIITLTAHSMQGNIEAASLLLNVALHIETHEDEELPDPLSSAIYEMAEQLASVESS